jgi:hypothetical protein
MRVEIVVFFSCVYRTCVTLFLSLLAVQVKDLVVSMSFGALIQLISARVRSILREMALYST